MGRVKELSVISKSKSLVRKVYKISYQLPESEKYILIPQILRAAISIPSNIVEGQQRTDKEFIRFITISRGSLFELKIQIEIIKDNYPDINSEILDDILHLINEIGKMTYGLMLKLKSDADKKSEAVK